MSAPNLIAAVIQKIHQHVQARCWSELVLLCENILPHFPDKVLIYQYLGLAQRELRAYQSAEKALKTALRLSPENISTLNHLGRLYQRQQAPQTALEYFERALHLLPPGHQAAPRIHFNQALCWLALGQYQKGFLAYLEKRRTGDDPSAPKQITYYQGEELQGKTLLLHSTEGIGDALFLIPLIMNLYDQHVRVEISCQNTLVKLFQNLKIFSQIWPPESSFQAPSASNADYYLPLYALPHYMRLTPQQLPLKTRFIKASAIINKHKNTGTNIALVWRCNPESPSVQRRSIELAELIKYLQQTNTTNEPLNYLSLQVNPRPEDSLLLKKQNILSLGSILTDFESTSHALAEIDLLISIDTATAHLAAAIGKEVWLLLAYESDWRWQLAENHSPWYPSIRIFRQPSPGDWQSVLLEIAQLLKHPLPKQNN